MAGVVDRTNVTSAQVELKRVQSESLFFVRHRIRLRVRSGKRRWAVPRAGLAQGAQSRRARRHVRQRARPLERKRRGHLLFRPARRRLVHPGRPRRQLPFPSALERHAVCGPGRRIHRVEPRRGREQGPRPAAVPGLRDVPRQHRALVRAGGRDPAHLRGDAQDAGARTERRAPTSASGLRPLPCPSASASAVARTTTRTDPAVCRSIEHARFRPRRTARRGRACARSPAPRHGRRPADRRPISRRKRPSAGG